MPTSENSQKNLYLWLAIALLLVYVVLSALTTLNTSGTCDEIAHHIAVGYSFLKTGDFRLNPSNPPLIREIMALPFLISKPALPLDHPSWQEFDAPEFSRQFFYFYNQDADNLINSARFMILGLGLLLALLVYFWSAKLYGRKAGLFSLFLYAFSPNIIAHSSLATLDLGFSFFFLLSLITFWNFLKNPDFKNIFLASLAFGLAQSSKYTALILYPLYLGWVIFRFFKRDAKREIFIRGLLFIFFFSQLVIWATYFFEFKPILKNVANPEEKLEFAQRYFSRVIPASVLDKILKSLPLPLSSYLMGILGVLKHAHSGHLTYFWGNWLQYGSRLYYLVAFLVKTPIPVLILIFLLLKGLIKERKISQEELFILIAIFFLFLIASLSKLQLGLRYILPVYPLFFILLGRSFKYLSGTKLRQSLFILLAFWYISSTLKIVPHSLSYFNELIGGPKNGYKYLRDSNIDWGQDLKSLAKVLDKLGIENVKLSYFGQALPEYYGIIYQKTEQKDFESPERGGFYAISLQYLDSFKWTQDVRPIARAGWSIYVYKLID